MKILHLTLKSKWFDMIRDGVKREEYREIKPYWESRLLDDATVHSVSWNDGMKRELVFRQYDQVCFTNGYAKDAPKVFVECHGVTIGGGVISWGAEPGKQYFVIRLGKVRSLKSEG